jgi:hypothetical protein
MIRRRGIEHFTRILWVLLLGWSVALVGCGTSKKRRTASRSHTSLRHEPTAIPTVSEASTPPEQRRWSPRPETRQAIDEVASGYRRYDPFSAPHGRLAFFARNIASLTLDSVSVAPVRPDIHQNPCRTNRLNVEEPRELTPLNDQSLLVIGARTAFVLDSNCETRVTLPKISYIPGNQVITEPRWPRAFTVLDAPSGTTYRYQWKPDQHSIANVLLPIATRQDPLLKGAICTPTLDASLACVRDGQMLVAWPGHSARRVAALESGAPVVKLLRADRADRVRVIRQDATLHELALTGQATRIASFPLPQTLIDVVAGRGFLALLQADAEADGSTSIRLVVLESDGTLRWSIRIDTLPRALSDAAYHREFFECRSLATHPVLPWIAASNCSSIGVYAANNGERLQSVERAQH